MSKKMVHECDNCGWSGPESRLGRTWDEMDDLHERISPGCPCPSGECPKCQACCYPLDENERIRRSHPGLLDACKRVLSAIEHNLAEDYLPETRQVLRDAIAKATQE